MTVARAGGSSQKCEILSTFWLTNGLMWATIEPMSPSGVILRNPNRLDEVFFALGCETRRLILRHLARRGVQKVSDLAKPFAMTKQAITKHLKILERAGLIRREVRGREHHCSLEATPMHRAATWLEEYRQFWEGSLDSLGAYLEETQRDEQV